MDNNELQEKIKLLEQELNETKEHLKKYTSPIRNKIYYEANKEKHKQKVKEYKEKINYNSTLAPEKKKEYAKQAYINKKAKMKKMNENEDV
jgi:hypothetical protein